MDSLRTQLADTQTALTERDKKFRQLRAEFVNEKTAWAQEKLKLEAVIEQLKLEKYKTLSTLKSSTSAVGENTSDAGSDEVVTISRAQMNKAETDFKTVVDQLTGKISKCAALEAKLALSDAMLVVEQSEDQVMAQWNQLREQISSFSLVYLNKTFEPKMLSDLCQRDLAALSPHWKTYTNTEDLPCYLFRAFIWRYLLRYFDIFCRAYGRDVSKKVSDVATLLWKDSPEFEFNNWRIRTASLVNKVYPIDQDLVTEVTQKIFEEIMPVLANKDTGPARPALHDIVMNAAELSAIFDRSNYLVLMQDEPGSTKLHSFPYAEKLMEIAWKLGSKQVVDLMITPSLLKKETDYKVLVKAEVACG